MNRSDAVVLCADSPTLRNPELMGLPDESIFSHPWLTLFSSAADARSFLRDHSGPCEAWVNSADDMDAINLAAALKRDRPDHQVSLVGFSPSGSILSRAKAAGIDSTLTCEGLASRLAAEKRRRAGSGAAATQLMPAGAGSLVPAPPLQTGVAVPAVPAASAAVFGSGVPAAAPLAAEAAAFSSPSAPPRAAGGKAGFLLTVVSGSGGAGKSATSALCAHQAAARGYRTLLVDCDLQFGDMRLLSGARECLGMAEVLESPAKLAAVQPSSGMPVVVAAPPQVEQAEVLAAKLAGLLDAALPLFDVIIANTGASWAEYHAQLLERSSATLFLVDQRISSVRACQRALDLCARCGIATGSFLYAVNRCERHALFTSIDVSCALDGAHVVELKDGGAAVEELLGAGLASELVGSRNAFCESLDELLEGLLPNPGSGFGSGLAPDKAPKAAGGRFGKGMRAQRRRRKHGDGRGNLPAHCREEDLARMMAEPQAMPFEVRP